MSSLPLDSTPPPSHLTIRPQNDGDGMGLLLEGEIDLASAPDLDGELRRLEAWNPQTITLDLGRVQFIDSTGLHVVYAAQRRAETNGHRLVLSHLPRHAQRLLSLTGLDAQLDIE